MFITIFGIQISILGLIGIGLGILSMIILVYKQTMTWYIWSLWITLSVVWLLHYVLFLDIASLIDTSIWLILDLIGLFSLFKKKSKKKKRR